MIECKRETLDGQGLRLSLIGHLTIYTAAQVKGELLQALNESAVLELDLEAVEEMDTAGFQLLLLAQKESKARGHELLIVAVSPAVQEVILFYNLDKYLGLSLLIPADQRVC